VGGENSSLKGLKDSTDSVTGVANELGLVDDEKLEEEVEGTESSVKSVAVLSLLRFVILSSPSSRRATDAEDMDDAEEVG